MQNYLPINGVYPQFWMYPNGMFASMPYFPQPGLYPQTNPMLAQMGPQMSSYLGGG